MKIEIDQSGKIEETNRDTVIAFSNSINNYIIIRARTKRKLLSRFRLQNKPKLYIYRTFCTAVFILIKPYLPKISTMVIDIEWEGKNSLIKDILIELLNKTSYVNIPTIHFANIGKGSSAHKLALSVFRSRKYNNNLHLLTFDKLLHFALKPNKKRPRSKID